MARIFQPPPHVAIELLGRNASRDARRAVSQLLATAIHADWHDDATLVVSELVANAMQECGHCRLAIWYIDDIRAFRVEVTDSSPQLPVPRLPSSDRVGGHGLRIVEALSSRWGVISEHDAKTVWSEIDG